MAQLLRLLSVSANATYSVFFFFCRYFTSPIMSATTAMRNTTAPPPIIAHLCTLQTLAVLELLWVELLGDSEVVSLVLNVAAVHNFSSREKIETGQFGLTVKISPPTVTVVPIVTQASIREIK